MEVQRHKFFFFIAVHFKSLLICVEKSPFKIMDCYGTGRRIKHLH